MLVKTIGGPVDGAEIELVEPLRTCLKVPIRHAGIFDYNSFGVASYVKEPGKAVYHYEGMDWPLSV